MFDLFLYPILVILLVIFLYFIPGLALFPKFIQSPRSSASIPFISISTLAGIQYLLSLINQFNQASVLSIIALLSFLAFYKIYKNYSEFQNSWTKLDLKVLLFIIFSSIPLMVVLGFDGFQHSDEIYSWNLWAKKIYLGIKVTFESTGSPYPLVLSSFIAFCYKFFGNMDYQLPIKFTFSIIYISTIFLIYSFVDTKVKLGLFFITYIIIMLVIGVGYEYKKVFADTLMGGLLVTSLALLISLSKDLFDKNNSISPYSYLFASIILISTAALTKQGAMLWAFCFYPLLALVIIGKNSYLNNRAKVITLIPLATPLIWYFLGGSGFQGNAGVINRSMSDRSYFDQLLHGFNETFINNPFIFLLMIIVFITLFNKANLEKYIIAAGILVSTILLLLFGAYETSRLYLHIILIGWLVIFAFETNILNGRAGYFLSRVGNSKILLSLIIFLFSFWSLSLINERIKGTVSQVSNLLDGREVQANWIIGGSGAEQYRKIINSQMGWWAYDDHVWGIFYGLDNFYRGSLESYDTKYIMQEIVKNNIGWIYSNDWHISEVKKIETLCNGSILKLETKPNLYKQTLFQIYPKKINDCNQLLD